MPQLIIQERGRAEPLIHTCMEDRVSIGRMEENIVQLRGRGVSRRHAQITTEGDQHYLVDLKSGNGTFLNGSRIASGEKHLLRAGDLITIDTFDIRFHQGEALPQPIEEEVTGSDILEVKLLKKVLTALDKEMVPSLEVLNGTAEGKKLYLTDELSEFNIGRDPECEFSLNEVAISRRHAQVLKRWGGIAVRDLESKNGVFVNNRRVVEEYLHDGDRVAFGTIVCLFRNPQEINLAQLDEIKPKARPAPVRPEEIPGLEQEPEPPMPQEQAPEEEFEEQEPGEQTQEQWERLEQNMAQAAYPVPQPHVEAIKRLTPVEIGMIGLGGLVIIFALITIVNLMAS